MFENAESAAKAMKEKQSFNFYGKPLKIVYSSNRSAILDKATENSADNSSSNVSNSNHSINSNNRKRERDEGLDSKTPVSKAIKEV